MSGSHSRSIKLIEDLLDHILPHLYPSNNGGGGTECIRSNPIDKAWFEKKEGTSRRRALIDPNVPPWNQGFVNAIYDFRAAHDVDKIVEANIAAKVAIEEAKVAEAQKQEGVNLSTSTQLQIYAPSTKVPAEGETA